MVCLAMISGYFLPLWEIQLWAPQYPEGLNMKIWLNRISGDFEIINGLNHYIGMKHIKQEMFPEFHYMGYVLAGLVAIGTLPVIVGKTRLLLVFVVVLCLAAGLGLFDFYRWGHDYGHDLDPKAAISVPGMSYQPPIIGYKSLLNFVAYSGPEKGGWILIGSGTAATLLLVLEILRGRKAKRNRRGGLQLLVVSMACLLAGCDPGPVAIDYGKDDCAECKMLIVDKRYGTAFVTDKGKVYKFDDVNCLLKFMNGAKAPAGKAMVVDYAAAEKLLPVEQASFLKHPGLRTPMNSGLAAFADAELAGKAAKDLEGEGKVLSWKEVQSETGECTCAP